MKISEEFPSKYLRASDLQNSEHRVKISYVEIEQMGQGDKKPVCHFVGKQKGLVLNKTNAITIAKQYGDDSESWRGREIVLYPTHVDVRGESKEAIRVKPAPRNGAQKSLSETSALPNNGEDLNDEIPF